jgi:hypothetical protein
MFSQRLHSHKLLDNEVQSMHVAGSRTAGGHSQSVDLVAACAECQMFSQSASQPAAYPGGRGFYWQSMGPYTCSMGEAGVSGPDGFLSAASLGNTGCCMA